MNEEAGARSGDDEGDHRAAFNFLEALQIAFGEKNLATKAGGEDSNWIEPAQPWIGGVGGGPGGDDANRTVLTPAVQNALGVFARGLKARLAKHRSRVFDPAGGALGGPNAKRVSVQLMEMAHSDQIGSVAVDTGAAGLRHTGRKILITNGSSVRRTPILSRIASRAPTPAKFRGFSALELQASRILRAGG